MIVQRNKKWVVLDSSGRKVLGVHATRREAQAQLRAIEASKKREKERNKD